MKYIIIFFIVSFTKVFSQDVEYIGLGNSNDFTFYRVFKQKCPGYVTHNNCLRFIDFISQEKPYKNSFYECDTEIKFRKKLNDTIVLTANVNTFLLKLKNSNQEIYSKVKDLIPFDFNKWDLMKLVDNKKFKIYRYYSKNVKYYIFKLKYSFLNDELLEGNILVQKPEFDNYIYLKIPISEE